jgi:hypothetical protein
MPVSKYFGQILKTYNILTHVLDGRGGDKSETYSGIYRKGNVVAGFSSFIAPVLVSSMMKALVSNFNIRCYKGHGNDENSTRYVTECGMDTLDHRDFKDIENRHLSTQASENYCNSSREDLKWPIS